jgi:predicted phage tail protein
VNDRHISLNHALSTVLWVVGGIIIVIAFITQHTGESAAGVYVAMLGACLMIRGYVIELSKYLQHRENNAFELGRDSTDSSVRDFRRH